jgi:hypothetical protein
MIIPDVEKTMLSSPATLYGILTCQYLEGSQTSRASRHRILAEKLELKSAGVKPSCRFDISLLSLAGETLTPLSLFFP